MSLAIQINTKVMNVAQHLIWRHHINFLSAPPTLTDFQHPQIQDQDRIPITSPQSEFERSATFPTSSINFPREVEQCDTSIFRSDPLDPLFCQPRQPHNVQKLQHLRVYLINSLFLTPPQWPPSETWRHVLLVLLLWAQNLQCFWSPDTVCCFSFPSSTNVQKPKTIQWHHLDLLSMCFGKRRWIHGPIVLYRHTAGIRRFWSLLCRISGTTSSTSNVCGEENSLKSKLKHHFVVVDGGLCYYHLQSLCISLVSNLYFTTNIIYNYNIF